MSVSTVPAAPGRRWTRQPGLWAAVAVLLLHAWWLHGLAEDAFISFRFARHLAQGAGLTWNLGAAPIEGYTNFLWVLVEAALIRAGADLIRVMPLLGVVLAAITLILIYRTLVVRLGVHEWTAGFAALLLAASGPFATWATSGMETTLFTLLAWLAFDALVASRPTSPLIASAWLVLATLTRPEGVLLAAVLLGASAVLARRHGSRVSTYLLAAACYVVPVALYGAWRWHYFGWPLPNTFYAKTGGGLEQWMRGILLTGHFLFEFILPLVPWVFLVAWACGLPRWFSRRDDVPLVSPAMCVAAGVLALVTLYIVAVGGDYMAMHRFFVVLLPFWYVALACLIDPLVRGRETAPQRQAVLLLAAWSLIATVVHSTPVDTLFFVRPSQEHGNYQGVVLERWHVARLSVIGRYFATSSPGQGETLGTSAIGAIGYYADMPILDFHGLVDLHIAHAPVPPEFGGRRPGHERHDWPYVLDQHPTFLMFSRDLTPQPIQLDRYLPREMTPDLRDRLDRDYEHASVWLEDPDNRESGFFTFLRRRADRPLQSLPGTR